MDERTKQLMGEYAALLEQSAADLTRAGDLAEWRSGEAEALRLILGTLWTRATVAERTSAIASLHIADEAKAEGESAKFLEGFRAVLQHYGRGLR